MNVRGYVELPEEAMMRAEIGECPFCGNTEVGKNGCTDEARWCYKCRASWLLCYKFVGVKLTRAPEKE